MNDPHTPSGTAALPKADEPATYRLVIRARVIQEQLPQSDRPHLQPRVLATVGGGVAILAALIWAGISLLGTDSSTLTPDNAATAVSTEPQQPVNDMASAAAPSVDANSMQPAPVPAPVNAEGSTAPIHEVLPTVPRSALQTIRGTVRVVIRVTIDKQGRVVAASSQDRGPSRYFERLALESSRQWTFTPAATDEPRSALLRYNFTRDGATARANQLRAID